MRTVLIIAALLLAGCTTPPQPPVNPYPTAGQPVYGSSWIATTPRGSGAVQALLAGRLAQEERFRVQDRRAARNAAWAED